MITLAQRMDHQGHTSTQIPPHASVSSGEGLAPRAYHLIVEVAADADVTKALKRIRSAARFGVRVTEARPFRGLTRQLTNTAVSRHVGRPILSPDEDDDVFRKRAVRGFTF